MRDIYNSFAQGFIQNAIFNDNRLLDRLVRHELYNRGGGGGGILVGCTLAYNKGSYVSVGTARKMWIVHVHVAAGTIQKGCVYLSCGHNPKRGIFRS